MDGRTRTSRRGALRMLAVGTLAGALPASVSGPGQAQQRREVDVALALAVDASGSVNQRRFELQQRGYVDAFLDADVLRAIRSGAVIDDDAGKTLFSLATSSKDLKGKVTNTKEGAQALGEAVAKRAATSKIEKVVFDRAGYLYHGKVKAFADGARAGGLKF